MQTVVMPASATHIAWLEHYPPHSSAPVQTRLESLPITIGRNEDTELPIDSTRVSREHAVLTCEQGQWRVRDNGSTNGTFVNGQRIESVNLVDGDVLCVADVEIVFHLPAEKESSATMLIDGAATGVSGAADAQAWDLIRDARRMHEALTSRAVRNWFQPIVDLQSREPFAYEALSDAERGDIIRPDDRTRHTLLALECRLISRLRRLHRLLAIEQAALLPDRSVVFVRLAACEVGGVGVAESLARLKASLPDHRRLGVEIPYNAVCDIPHFQSFLGCLRACDAMVVYDDFAGGQSQARQLRAIVPDGVKLARAVVRGVEHSSDRQRQIENIVAAAGELNCRVIAGGVSSAAEAETCAELGCQFAQGEHFGRPRSIRALAQEVR